MTLSKNLDVFQIRYFNPKTKSFYFHGLTEAISPSPSSNSKNSVLVGEPEYYLYPAPNGGGEEQVHGYVNNFLHHHAVSTLILDKVLCTLKAIGNMKY